MNYEVFDVMPIGVTIVRLETEQVTYLNEKMKSILQLPSNVNEFPMKDLFHDDSDRLNFLENSKKHAEEKLVHKDVVNIVDTKNTALEMLFESVILPDPELTCYFFFGKDEIPMRKYINSDDVLEWLPHAVAVFKDDLFGSIEYCNQEFFNILETTDEFYNSHKEGAFISNFVYMEDREWLTKEIAKIYNKADTTIDEEFRLKSKKGIRWVRLHAISRQNKGEDRLVYASIKDISNIKDEDDLAHMEKILLSKLSELSNEVLFRVDLQKNTIHILGDKAKQLGMKVLIENFPEAFIESEFIYEDDKGLFLEMVDDFYKGFVQSREIRMMTMDGDVRWCQIIYDHVKTKDGIPMFVVGKFVNVEQRKILEEKANFDLLTRCYNKVTTKSKVEELIRNDPSGQHVFYIVDIDNFKAINDNLGHHFGDMVLFEVADSLRACFRKGDIIGRIGGDEFVIVLGHCQDEKIIFERANQISEAMRKTYRGEEASYSISGSIGISIYPTNGYVYNDLYKMADKALYESKKQGKDCYTFYHPDIDTTGERVHTEMQNSTRARTQSIDINVVATVFNVLYETTDIMISLCSALQYLGIHYDLDRCFIFENKGNEEVYVHSFEWSRHTGAMYIKEKNNVLPKASVDSLFAVKNDDGIFHTNDMKTMAQPAVRVFMEEENIHSLFMVESIKKSYSSLFLGFADAYTERIWADNEIQTLFHISRIIFSSLESYNLHMLLDAQLQKSYIENHDLQKELANKKNKD
ncbi:MAG: diguanylate cyclase [Bacillota bacterium]